MNLKRLLRYGYFPKELPPPFETVSFSEKSRFVKTKWNNLLRAAKVRRLGETGQDAEKRFKRDYTEKYGSSGLATYGLAKGLYSRRKLGIPNPKQFMDLSSAMIDNWSLLSKSFKLSNYSQSSVVEKGAKRAVTTKSKSWNNFKFALVELSFSKKVELKLDITQFYPSIYTHSIPWSIMGKSVAKRFFRIKNTQKAHWASLLLTNRAAKKYQVADLLDTLIRNCNERQSIGLPIGPDTSFIFAEIIAGRIDSEIENKLKGIAHSGARYFDDYYFYFNTHDDATTGLKTIQRVLSEFNLETNDGKVSINALPFDHTETWALELSAFKFSKIDKYELRAFFSILFRLLEDNKKNTSWIVHYALGRFEYGNVKVKLEDWDLFLSLLLQTLLVDPGNMDQIFKIILSYLVYLNKKSKQKISEVLEIIIRDHLPLNHSFEVSWSLWAFKSFKIKCSNKLLAEVLRSDDTISKMIALDLIKSKLYSGRKPKLSALASSINSSYLFNENWLLAYEAFKKGWVDFKGRNIIDGHEFMKIIYDYGVFFYKEDNQLLTEFRIPDPNASIFDLTDEDEVPWSQAEGPEFSLENLTKSTAANPPEPKAKY